MENTLVEYELIDISLSIIDDFEDRVNLSYVHDDTQIFDNVSRNDEEPIIYDANGIPMGQSIVEIRMRENVIMNFWNELRQRNSERCIYNEKIQEQILLRSISITEAKEHASKSYKSTLAFLKLEEVLAKASPVGRDSVKSDDKNQAEFDYMLIMVYRDEMIGTIRVTVGVRRALKKEAKRINVQYGISAIKPGKPLISKKEKTKKKAPHKK